MYRGTPRTGLRLLTLCIAIIAAIARADVNTFSGSATKTLPIEVPPFHGLEPKLALTYSSGGGNGYVGVGWDLAGFSEIERTSANGGSPNWDSTDIFLLDGMKVVPCPTGSTSPSCTTGGTHVTKVESYQRIKYVSASDTWEITRKDGTRLVYNGIYWMAAGKMWRYGLSTVTDTRGNTVTYTWSVNQYACCWAYPTGVNYNGVSVVLDWEQRSDAESRGNSFSITHIYGRIKTIQVKVSGNPLRAYKLSYTMSTSSPARSLLTRVQMFGRDYTLDGTKTVTGGTSLPAVTMTYLDTDSGGYTDVWQSIPTGYPDTNGTLQAGDYDGDGKTDLIHIVPRIWDPNQAWDMQIWKATGSGAFTRYTYSFGPGYGTNVGVFYVVDLNGDGKADVLHTSGWNAFISTGSCSGSTCGFTRSGVYMGFDESTRLILPADVNGDGKTDLLTLSLIHGSNGQTVSTVQAYTSNFGPSSTGFIDLGSQSLGGTYPLWSSAASSGGEMDVGDINGDGYADLIFISQDSIRTWIGNGNGTFKTSSLHTTPAGYICTNPNQCKNLSGDVNGDGKADLIAMDRRLGGGASNPNKIRTMLSMGDGHYVNTTPQPMGPAYSTYYGELVTLDANGDGKTDIAHILGGTGCEVYTWIASGDGTYTMKWQGGLNENLYSTDGRLHDDRMAFGDSNGDGKDDILILNRFHGHLMSWTATGSVGTLVRSISNGLGSTETFTYSPSSIFPGNSAPGTAPSSVSTLVSNGASTRVIVPAHGVRQTVTAVSVTDGVDNTTSAGTTTTFSYWGALYDATERQFLGYRYVRTVRPKNVDESGSTGPIMDVYYKQGYGVNQAPEWTYWYTAAGVVMRYEGHEWMTDYSRIPYKIYEASNGSRDYESDGVAFRDRCASFTYDAYGNRTLESLHGDCSNSGDEKRIITGFVPNTTAFITGLPAYQQVWSGLSGGTRLAETLYGYDGAGAWNVQPTVGNLTSRLSWLDQDNSYIGTTFSYDSHGNEISRVDAMGNSSSTTYDSTYHVFPVSRTNTLQQTESMAFDAVCGVPTTITDVNGQQTVNTYDALCRHTREDRPLGGYTTWAYENFGNINAQRIAKLQTSANGSYPVSEYQHLNGLGQPWYVLTGWNGTTGSAQRILYHARGTLRGKSVSIDSASPPNPVPFHVFTYDALDRLVKTTHHDGSSSTASYQGWRTVLTDEMGHVRTTVQDAEGRIVQRKERLSGVDQTTTYTFDLLGRLTQVVDPVGNTTIYTYDSLGRRLTSADPDLGARAYAYNARGERIRTVDAKSQVIETTYDALGRARGMGVNRPSSSTVTINAVTNVGSGALLRLYVDSVNVATFTVGTPAANSTWTGKVISNIGLDCSNCAAGTREVTVNAIAVDADMRMGTDPSVLMQSATGQAPSTGILNSASVALNASFGEGVLFYDRVGHGSGVGRMTGTLDASGWVSYTYDAEGHITRRDHRRGGATYTFHHAYDAGGRLLGTRYPDGDVIGKDPTTGTGTPLGYDVWGHLASIPGIATSITYDMAGKPAALINANGTVQTFGYSVAREWGTSIVTTSGGSTIQSLSMTRNNEGQITRVANSVDGETWNYTYDDLEQLTSAALVGGATQSYAYNAIGNVTSVNGVAYTYPAAGQPRPHAVTSVGGNSYTYDANGNMLTGGGRTFTWNGFNKPLTIGDEAYTYDVLANRVRRVVNGTTTDYFGDDYEINNGTVTKIFSAFGIAIAQKVGTTLSWLHADHLGSIQVRTNSAGAVLERQTYKPYGGIHSGSLTSAVGFTSERRDGTGLMYLHARYYDPDLLRFVSADPIIPTHSLVGLNHYAYAANNPIMFHDRSGLAPCPDGDGACLRAEVRGDPLLTRLWGGVVAAEATGHYTKGGLLGQLANWLGIGETFGPGNMRAGTAFQQIQADPALRDYAQVYKTEGEVAEALRLNPDFAELAGRSYLKSLWGDVTQGVKIGARDDLASGVVSEDTAVRATLYCYSTGMGHCNQLQFGVSPNPAEKAWAIANLAKSDYANDANIGEDRSDPVLPAAANPYIKAGYNPKAKRWVPRSARLKPGEKVITQD